jgi:uncharacterized protein (TIGR00369 family)
MSDTNHTTGITLPEELRTRFAEHGIHPEMFSGGDLGSRLGITLLSGTPQQVTGTMPVEGNRQPYGLLHGGASAALAETLGSIGAMLHAGPGRYAVGVDLSATHHRAAREGTITGTATALHLGRTVATYDIALTDDTGRRICTARLTCNLRDT